MFVALTMVAASIYQMMRGLIVVIVALMSVIFLKRKLFRHHWTGAGCIVAGIIVVGVCSIIYDDSEKKVSMFGEDESAGAEMIGIILLLASQFCAGTMMIIEEKLLGNYYLNPLKVVGWEGVWGFSIYVVLLVIFQFIPVSEGGNFGFHGKLEDSIAAFKQFGHNIPCLMYSVGSIFSIAAFNGFGMAVTKFASAAQRSTIDTSRTLLIWVFFLCMPRPYKEFFHALQLVGFVFLVCGTLLFNEIVVLPFWGFNESTKEALARR